MIGFEYDNEMKGWDYQLHYDDGKTYADQEKETNMKRV